MKRTRVLLAGALLLVCVGSPAVMAKGPATHRPAVTAPSPTSYPTPPGPACPAGPAPTPRAPR